MPYQSVSSNSRAVNQSNRKFLVFCAFLLTLVVGSFLQLAYSSLHTYDRRRANQEAFLGKRFLRAGAILQARTADVVHQARRSTADIHVDEALYCDRSHYRTDICVARGDVRVMGGTARGGSYQVLVFAERGQERIEKLKPYTRKWEKSVMKTIDEVTIIRKAVLNESRSVRRHGRPNQSSGYIQPQQRVLLQERGSSAIQGDQARRMRRMSGPARYDSSACGVRHKVPAILFSTGGYTGNVYHEFNDGLIPLYITAQKYPPGQVVLVVLEYHRWWITKYTEVLAQISNYTVIDLAHDRRLHCFPEVTVGLRIHDELAIHAENHDHASIQGFQSMLRAAYGDKLLKRPKRPKEREDAGRVTAPKRPKLVLMSRSSPRALVNEAEVITMVERIGFSVQVLRPTPRTRMLDIYEAVSGCEVMVGVHGAAMTHLVFMKPGATLIQVVPLGIEWAAATYYGEPAQKLGLNYVPYKLRPKESSLYEKYGPNDPVVVNPESVNQKGWWETKRIYLEGQDITVSLHRFRATLLSAYSHT